MTNAECAESFDVVFSGKAELLPGYACSSTLAPLVARLTTKQQYKLVVRRSNSKLTVDQRMSIRVLAAKGIPATLIAITLGVPRSTVSRWIRRWSGSVRRPIVRSGAVPENTSSAIPPETCVIRSVPTRKDA